MKGFFSIGLLLFFLVATSFSLFTKKKNIWLIGDSTIAIKDTNKYPETGWGMPFVWFWDSTIKVENRARNGRSTRSFREEGSWDPVQKNMQEGDYVLIQFGHNDEVITKVATYTTPEQFTANLERYVAETREKKAIPILITPVARRRFDSVGKVIPSHPEYSALVRKVAEDKEVILIDLDTLTQALYQSWGKENSRWLFLQLKPGEHPNYPDGRDDNTHFSELGARLVAQIVLKELKEKCPELATHVILPKK